MTQRRAGWHAGTVQSGEPVWRHLSADTEEILAGDLGLVGRIGCPRWGDVRGRRVLGSHLAQHSSWNPISLCSIPEGGSPSPLLCPGAHCSSRPSMTSLPSSLLLESSFFMVSCFHSRIVSLPCFSCQIPHHGQQGFPSLGSRLPL